MVRLLERQILDWKNNAIRKPLVIRGARQTGKTWLVKQIGNRDFQSFITVDFEKRRDIHRLFESSLDPKVILPSLELIFGRIIPGETLLFFDEIQACPRAITSLCYFYEELPELHIISAGSLLEFAFGEISVPVGRINYMNLFPMTFYEYLLACHKEVMSEEVLHPSSDSPEFIQLEVLNELKNYFLIGGMPEAVKTWRETNSLREVFQIQDDILNSYRDDFSKYKPAINIHCLDSVFKQSSIRVGEQIKYTTMDRQFSGQTNRKALELLEKARIIHKIYSTNPSGLPLGAGVNQRKFKLAFLDIGLMQRLSGMPVPNDYFQTDILAIFQGKLAEQFIAQEIAAACNRDLYYWAREAKSSTAEVDFLIIKDGRILPVEVKSGKSGSLKSMHLILKEYPSLPSGAVLYDSTLASLTEQKLDFYPLYYISSLIDRR